MIHSDPPWRHGCGTWKVEAHVGASWSPLAALGAASPPRRVEGRWRARCVVDPLVTLEHVRARRGPPSAARSRWWKVEAHVGALGADALPRVGMGAEAPNLRNTQRVCPLAPANRL
jgi:hypothetical protein